jgi:hypothetical protein
MVNLVYHWEDVVYNSFSYVVNNNIKMLLSRKPIEHHRFIATYVQPYRPTQLLEVRKVMERIIANSLSY